VAGSHHRKRKSAFASFPEWDDLTQAIAFLVTLGGAVLYPAPLATLFWLGGKIRRLCPMAGQLAARVHKLAG
jgi:hypothetical protein